MTHEPRSLQTCLAAFAALSLMSVANAETVSVTDGTANNFGDTNGVAIDFDATTGLAANWTPDLSTSQQYSIDSVTLFNTSNAADSSTATVRLGVYTTLTGETVGGFQGVSTNTIDLSTVALGTPFTFNFSGISVTPGMNAGTGADIRYFAFQIGDTAITDLRAESTRVPIRRIDAETGSFTDELAAVIQASGNTSSGLVGNRAPEYSATITPVPEPSAAIMLLGGAGILGVLRRRC